MTEASRRAAPDPDAQLLLDALSEVAGCAIVLDRELRVLAHTPGARQLVGTPLPAGVAAPKLLCGMGPERPLAEALAEGRAITALVERVGPDETTSVLRVRATPLSHDGQRAGWLLLLESEQPEGALLDFGGFVTQDAAVRRLLDHAQRAAATDAPVVLGGEHGSGKGLLARLIHDHSPRAEAPFCAVDCAARPAARLEVELFGSGDAPGQLRAAQDGTLFLDEVAELPLELQGRLLDLLRAEEPGAGGAGVRLVASTAVSLRERVEQERFRAELMHRLQVIPLFVPPLCERRGDIELLANHFVARENQTSQRQVSRIAPDALAALRAYRWPGNVRELGNAIRYAYAMGDGPLITRDDLPPQVRDGDGAGRSLPVNVTPGISGQLPGEARRLLRALERAGGNRERAAQSLGISRVTLWRKLKAFDLEDAARAGRRSQRH